MSSFGGFIEKCSTAIVRPRPAMSLPQRGQFQFPAPYNTLGVRVTNIGQEIGKDALGYGYSYWPRINAHAGRKTLRVLLGVNRNLGGPGPCVYEVNKETGAVLGSRALFLPEDALSWDTAETWYWSLTDPDVLYCNDAQHLYRLHLDRGEHGFELDTVVDITASDLDPGATKILWQWHTDASGRVHSATLKDATTYQPEGTIVYDEDRPAPWLYYPKVGVYDEAQIDKSGTWLLIKDNLDGQYGEDNIIQQLEVGGFYRTILDQAGAAGHSDNGFGYMVAADNWHSLPGAIRCWMFDEGQAPQGQVVYHTPSWDAEMNHVSHCNATLGDPASQYVVGSGASRTLAPRNNEVVGFRLDGSLECVVIAPTLVDLNAPGGGDDYARLPKGSLDPYGEWFVWTSNAGGAYLDAFLVQVPTELFGVSPHVCNHACPLHCVPQAS